MHNEEQDINHLAPLVAGAVAVAPKVLPMLEKIKPLAAIAKKTAAFAGKIGLGGVTRERFMTRQKEILKMFTDAGYSNDIDGTTFAKKYKVVLDNIPDKLKKSTYRKEFDRLFQMTVARLNANNPGYGDLFATYTGGFKMVNKGDMHKEPLQILKIFLDTYKPRTYKPGDVPPDVEPNNTGETETEDRSVPGASEPVTAPALAGIGSGLSGNMLPIALAVVVIIILISIGMKK